MIKALLKRYKYPPDQEGNAIDLVLQQTEMISEEWSREDLGNKIQAVVADALGSGGFQPTVSSIEPVATMMRIECSRRPRKCSRCGNPLVGKILYGMPDFSKELEESLEKGEVILGGCCLVGDDPAWQCKKCGQQFWRKGAVPS